MFVILQLLGIIFFFQGFFEQFPGFFKIRLNLQCPAILLYRLSCFTLPFQQNSKVAPHLRIIGPRFKYDLKLFYRLIYRITDVDIPLDTGDFRLMDRKVVEQLKGMREHHRFIRGMTSWVGFKQTGVTYVREERHSGKTKYPLRKMIRLAITAITGFSIFPLQLATFVGFVIAVLSSFLILLVIIARLSGSQAFIGQATTLVMVLFMGGVQLISLGIIGEYLGRIYDEVRARPLYVVNKTVGFDPPGDTPQP